MSKLKKVPVIGGALNSLLNGPEQVQASQIDAQPFNISKEATQAGQTYSDLLKSSQAAQQAGAANKALVLNQMGQAAAGQGPSLAEAQLKAAQDRTLAQQLATTQSLRGGSAALNQRNMAQTMSQQGRALAQDASVARLAERDNFLNQSNMADQNLRTDIQGQFGYNVANKRENQARVTGNANFQQQANTANTAANNQFNGQILGAAATAGLGFAGGGGLQGAKDAFMPKKMATGGLVEGPGTSTSDSIPVDLSNGEFVVRSKVASQPAILKVLTKVNKGVAPSKAEMSALAKVLSSKSKAK